MVIHHALIFASDCRFHSGSVRIRNGVFTEVRTDGRAAEPEAGEPALDARGNYLIPGLVDIHFHGAVGADVSDDTDEAFRKIAAYEAREGITAICPATLTLAEERLCSILRRGHAFSKSNAGRADCADLIGFNMEGPFISRARKGAQNEKYIRACDVNLAERFIDASGGLVRYIGVAPEENPEADGCLACGASVQCDAGHAAPGAGRDRRGGGYAGGGRGADLRRDSRSPLRGPERAPDVRTGSDRVHQRQPPVDGDGGRAV